MKSFTPLLALFALAWGARLHATEADFHIALDGQHHDVRTWPTESRSAATPRSEPVNMQDGFQQGHAQADVAPAGQGLEGADLAEGTGTNQRKISGSSEARVLSHVSERSPVGRDAGVTVVRPWRAPEPLPTLEEEIDHLRKLFDRR